MTQLLLSGLMVAVKLAVERLLQRKYFVGLIRKLRYGELGRGIRNERFGSKIGWKEYEKMLLHKSGILYLRRIFVGWEDVAILI